MLRKAPYLIAVTFALSQLAVAQQTTTPASKLEIDPVVMAFGTTQVRQSELEGALKSVPAEYQSYAAGVGKKAFAEEYARMKMLAAEGIKNGLERTPEVAAQLAMLRDNAIANAQLTRIESEIKLSDADLQKSYDDRKATFEQSKARHILIAFTGSRAAQPSKPKLTEDQAKAKAEEIRTKLVAGADFAETAKKESDDTGSGARGGDLGTFSRGQMVPEFEKASFEGKVGEIGPVVRTEFGYHIIQVQERKTSPLTEVRAQLEKELRQSRLQEKLDSMKESGKITFNEAYFPTAPVPPATETVTAASPAEGKKKPVKKP
ncbi:MAG TPA: peptidylprolyl isomerase [Thermoanaerobaculia bacterium]|nr:peptidylprolyl isomerase [Thermoanaerobaculia bacterium]